MLRTGLLRFAGRVADRPHPHLQWALHSGTRQGPRVTVRSQTHSPQVCPFTLALMSRAPVGDTHSHVPQTGLRRALKRPFLLDFGFAHRHFRPARVCLLLGHTDLRPSK